MRAKWRVFHIDDVERRECTVNSSKFAGHGRALQRSKHQLLFTYRKNPSVCPRCLGKTVGTHCTLQYQTTICNVLMFFESFFWLLTMVSRIRRGSAQGLLSLQTSLARRWTWATLFQVSEYQVLRMNSIEMSRAPR